jgi:metal-responsive CopG/Arc/MetJ family transcriptional regulator
MAKGKTPFIAMKIEADLLQRIEEFRWKHRFKSRTEAMKWLMAWALKQNPKPPA